MDCLGFVADLLIKVADGMVSISECIIQPLNTFWIYGYLPLDAPLWFLLSLFSVKIITHFLFRTKIHPIFICIVGFGIAFLLHAVSNPHIPVWLANIPMGLAFFILGYLLHKFECKLWLLIPCILGYIVFIIFDTPVVGLHRNVHLAGNYYLWPVFSICGIVTFNNLCRWIYARMERLKCIRPISQIGKHSLLLLVSHAFVYMPIVHYSKLSPISTFLIIESIYLFVLIPSLLIYSVKSQKSILYR